jgi:8-oxo-dGTP pyrophosphatase MutT (NUDIX family)
VLRFLAKADRDGEDGGGHGKAAERKPFTMSYLQRIRTCQRWEPEDYRPFVIEDRRMGRVGRDFAAVLARYPKVFLVSDAAVSLNPVLEDFETRSEAVEEVMRELEAQGEIGHWRDEDYPVLRRWGEPPLMKIERGAVPKFGIRGFGVHMHGLVADENGGDEDMWIAKRSATKTIEPGKLDQIVAGGQPIGVGIHENLIKECSEEAGIPENLASKAKPVSAISFLCQRPEGLRDEFYFIYELELPRDFHPENCDGEVECFYRWPISKVLTVLQDSEEFEYSVALVLIDYAIRHGHFSPEMPDYQEIFEGLRRARAD